MSRRLILLGIYLMFSLTHYSFAGPSEDFAEAKLETSFLKLQKSIEPYVDLLWDSQSNDDQITDKLDGPTHRYLEEVIAELPTEDTVKKTLFLKVKTYFQWKHWKGVFLSKKEHLVKFAKEQGPIAIATIMGESLHNTILPAIAVKIGHPELVPLILGYPSYIFIHSANMKIYNFFQDIRMAKFYGGFKQMKSVHKSLMETRRELKLKATSDLLMSFEDPILRETRLMVGKSTTFFSKFFSSSGALNLSNFENFLRSNQLWTVQHQSILDAASLNEMEKLFIIFKDFSESSTQEKWISFQSKFNSSFVNVPSIDKFLRAQSKLPRPIKSLEEFTSFSRELKVFPPSVQWQLWNEYYLPIFLENNSADLSYADTKKLREVSLITFARTQNPEFKKLSSDEFVTLFVRELGALGKLIQDCSKMFSRLLTSN